MFKKTYMENTHIKYPFFFVLQKNGFAREKNILSMRYTHFQTVDEERKKQRKKNV